LNKLNKINKLDKPILELESSLIPKLDLAEDKLLTFTSRTSRNYLSSLFILLTFVNSFSFNSSYTTTQSLYTFSSQLFSFNNFYLYLSMYFLEISNLPFFLIGLYYLWLCYVLFLCYWECVYLCEVLLWVFWCVWMFVICLFLMALMICCVNTGGRSIYSCWLCYWF